MALRDVDPEFEDDPYLCELDPISFPPNHQFLSPARKASFRRASPVPWEHEDESPPCLRLRDLGPPTSLSLSECCSLSPCPSAVSAESLDESIDELCLPVKAEAFVE
eukprot:CAMPEP_0184659146 /NCGR_PEP_ID=MMETSP0308-20130426/28462_1 /TAXON_ID=38269 /ORGANISM="Gloeochaete witrockiana, Strain SAG 46.84" /LENGTH=106 /DNA_ID=CAMNT_0027098717 /DNA_START=112 /DNA_END=432 /DNA_ORIENTATION=+